MGFHYRANSTAWNNTIIMKDWLIWFGKQTKGRQVVLLLDNFAPHILAAEALKEKGLIPHVRVLSLPANTTSHFQPLDQSIIRSWKAHYRRKMMTHVLDFLDANPDFEGSPPVRCINILHAARWAIAAWENGVSALTMEHCFTKSGVKLHGSANEPELQDPLTSTADARMEDEIATVENELLDTIRVAHPNFVTQDLRGFIQLADEDVENSEQQEDELIMRTYIAPIQSEEDDAEAPGSSELVPPPPISYVQALEMIEQLRIFRCQQPHPNGEQHHLFA